VTLDYDTWRTTGSVSCPVCGRRYRDCYEDGSEVPCWGPCEEEWERRQEEERLRLWRRHRAPSPERRLRARLRPRRACPLRSYGVRRALERAVFRAAEGVGPYSGREGWARLSRLLDLQREVGDP